MCTTVMHDISMRGNGVKGKQDLLVLTTACKSTVTQN